MINKVVASNCFLTEKQAKTVIKTICLSKFYITTSRGIRFTVHLLLLFFFLVPFKPPQFVIGIIIGLNVEFVWEHKKVIWRKIVSEKYCDCLYNYRYLYVTGLSRVKILVWVKFINYCTFESIGFLVVWVALKFVVWETNVE